MSAVPVFEPLQQGDPPLIGGYRVLARIGAGGMGRVYLATTQSGRRLAIKVVRPEFADDPEFRRRFQQEILAAQRVQSLYTAPVIDAHPDGPAPWLATAHVPGPSLAQAVADLGPLPAETVRVLCAGIAEALQAVHAAGVIHRDLKPSNVLLAADGPRVIDFGIARAAETTPLTRTGMRIGSPQFMAPEQALGRPSTPALDVFALGCVAFFAATGRTPFGDGPDTAVLFRIAHEEPVLDGCPEDLLPLITRCLDKDPEAQPTPREILDELVPLDAAPAPADWLPADITRRLPAYAAEAPAGPPPGPPTGPQGVPAGPQGAPAGPPGPPPRAHGAPMPPGPPMISSSAPPPGGPPRYLPPPHPSARPAGNKGLLIGGGVVAAVMLLLLVVIVMVNASGPSEPAGAAKGPQAHTTATGGPSGDTKSTGRRLGHYTGINLSNRYSISFTDDPKHPRLASDSEGDLRYDSSYLWGDRLAVLPPGQPGNYEACRDNTRYTAYLGPEYLIKGKLICVTTESGLTGLVRLTGRDDSPSLYLTFDLTVWQGVPPTPGN
ncbi:serine/threonine-protein kinase [Actinomadura macrotermitis]|uniref:Serine/threonine-protein kinase PknD n=1 Tax=Actinomadura macrotermitis TaxID=2585200 RepID=A0A7K0BRP7_9ACTN|nr:serine/threonine-protein kinase [Actinomadura macrotermitis]MQY03807.1 Serine/threonine-protein kinase PknD [Actinomadura macrotermitis]